MLCVVGITSTTPQPANPGAGSAQPWVSTLVRATFEHSGPSSVRTLHARVVAALEAKFPGCGGYLDDAHEDIPAFTAFPREVWRQIGPTTRYPNKRSGVGPTWPTIRPPAMGQDNTSAATLPIEAIFPNWK